MVTIPYALSKADGSRALAQSFTGEPKISARRTRQSGRGRSAFPVANPDRYRLPPGKGPLGGRGSVPPGADMMALIRRPATQFTAGAASAKPTGSPPWKRPQGGWRRKSTVFLTTRSGKSSTGSISRLIDQAPTPHIRPRTILRLFRSRTDFFRTSPCASKICH